MPGAHAGAGPAARGGPADPNVGHDRPGHRRVGDDSVCDVSGLIVFTWGRTISHVVAAGDDRGGLAAWRDLHALSASQTLRQMLLGNQRGRWRARLMPAGAHFDS